jgi:hypothetical protein
MTLGNEILETRFDTSPMSVKDWFITLLILAIPMVNLVMYLVWAFGSYGNLNRRNFCRAGLLMFALAVGIFLIFSIIFGGIAAINRSYV